MVSVIVPIYNAKNTLSRCIDSILNQTISDLELLLIDDGSTDCSLEICKRYCTIDNRVRAVYKKNGGSASARNLGLDIAQGEYVVFVDSDDYVDSNFLSGLLENRSFDCVLGAYEIFPARKTCCVFDEQYTQGDFTDFIKKHLSWGYQWGKLFRKSIIDSNNIRFCEGIIVYEDFLFCLDYMLFCNSIKLVPYPRYHYYDPSDKSVWEKYPLSANQIIRIIELINSRVHIICEKYPQSDVHVPFNILAHYNYSKILKGNDDLELYNLYCSIYGNKTKEIFYEDDSISPIKREIIRSYNRAKYGKGIDKSSFLKYSSIYHNELQRIHMNSKFCNMILFAYQKRSIHYLLAVFLLIRLFNR